MVVCPWYFAQCISCIERLVIFCNLRFSPFTLLNLLIISIKFKVWFWFVIILLGNCVSVFSRNIGLWFYCCCIFTRFSIWVRLVSKGFGSAHTLVPTLEWSVHTNRKNIREAFYSTPGPKSPEISGCQLFRCQATLWEMDTPCTISGPALGTEP